MNIFLEALRVAAKGLVVDNEDETIANQRLETCLSCDKITKDGQCGICMCFTDLKAKARTNINVLHARIEITHCPIGRWGDVEIANHYREIDGKPLIPVNKQ